MRYKVFNTVLTLIIVAVLACAACYAFMGGENGYLFLMIACTFGMACVNTIILNDIAHTGEDIIDREYRKILRADKKWQREHDNDDPNEICGRCD